MTSFISLIAPYQKRIDHTISLAIESFGPKTRLRDALEHVLKNGGKRVRPAIVYMVAEALGNHHDVNNAALAIEFFHTASLIADDLPCMDDEETRRSSAALHKAFDEATAILATYALIAAGYDRIRQNADILAQAGVKCSDTICMVALENATYNTGIFGATGGQYMDLFPSHLTEEGVREVIHKKTTTLFEISFVLGWLFGQGALTELDEVKKIAGHFGIAFQICDDFLDFEQDVIQKRVNYPVVVGIDRAYQTFSYEISELKRLLKKLGIDSSPLLAFTHLLEKKIEQALSKIAIPQPTP